MQLLCHQPYNMKVLLSIIIIITHIDVSRGSKVFSSVCNSVCVCVCVCVCLFVHTITPKHLKLKLPNLAQ